MMATAFPQGIDESLQRYDLITRNTDGLASEDPLPLVPHRERATVDATCDAIRFPAPPITAGSRTQALASRQPILAPPAGPCTDARPKPRDQRCPVIESRLTCYSVLVGRFLTSRATIGRVAPRVTHRRPLTSGHGHGRAQVPPSRGPATHRASTRAGGRWPDAVLARWPARRRGAALTIGSAACAPARHRARILADGGNKSTVEPRSAAHRVRRHQ